jgi:hypothetical protein
LSNLGLVPFVGSLALFFQLAKEQSDQQRREQVQTIHMLADQNAHAGAQGRGFAVVAGSSAIQQSMSQLEARLHTLAS